MYFFKNYSGKHCNIFSRPYFFKSTPIHSEKTVLEQTTRERCISAKAGKKKEKQQKQDFVIVVVRFHTTTALGNFFMAARNVRLITRRNPIREWQQKSAEPLQFTTAVQAALRVRLSCALWKRIEVDRKFCFYYVRHRKPAFALFSPSQAQ